MSQSIYNAFRAYKRQHGNGTATSTPSGDEADEAGKQPTESAAESSIGQLAEERQAIAPHKETKKEEPTHRPIFKVQLLASARQIPTGSERFKDIKPVDFYKEDNLYKYTCGATTDYREAVRMREKIKDAFEGAFIVAFKNGQKIPLQQAISESKKNP